MYLKKIITIFAALAVLWTAALPIYAESLDTPSFRVVGYCSEMFKDPVDAIQYDKLTNVIYAFLIPRADGSLIGIEKPEKLKALVAAAHAKGVKVSIAVGGWSYKDVPLQGNFEKMASDPKTRKLFVKNTVRFLKDNRLDGLDIDWEFPLETGPYEALVCELKEALNAEGMLLSAALNGAWSETGAPITSSFVTEKALACFDFINIMAYDADPTGPGHSPLWFADTSIRYWTLRGVPREKIIIGVPFYGAPGWVQYRSLIADNPENAYRDRAEITVGSWGRIPVYYNGIATIQEKTRLALLKAGGVMIFDINEDTFDNTSLISAIDDTVKAYGGKPSHLEASASVVVSGKPLLFSRNSAEGVPYVDAQNRVMVPLRKCLEHIGATVRYDEKTRQISAAANGVELSCTVGQPELAVNGTAVKMDTAASVKEGRTYVPVRFIYEAFGKTVAWHDNSRTVIVE